MILSEDKKELKRLEHAKIINIFVFYVENGKMKIIHLMYYITHLKLEFMGLSKNRF